MLTSMVSATSDRLPRFMMATHGVEVVGTDYNENLWQLWNAGHNTFKEQGLDELFAGRVEIWHQIHDRVSGVRYLHRERADALR